MRGTILSKEALRKMSLSILELDLSVRSQNGLINKEIEYVWQLVQYSDRDLLRIKNFGRKSLNEITGKLHGLGFRLATVLDPEQLEAITSCQHVPDDAYLAEWLKTTTLQLSRSPLDFLTDRQEKVLRKRAWVVGKKPSYAQVARSMERCGQTVINHEKNAIFKIQRHYHNELSDVNYYLLSEFAARCNSIRFSDTVFGLCNLSSQQQVITEFLLGLAVQDLAVDWEQSVLTLHGFTESDMRILKDYFTHPGGSVRSRFITKEFLGIQQSNEDIIRHLDTLHRTMWLEA